MNLLGNLNLFRLKYFGSIVPDWGLEIFGKKEIISPIKKENINPASYDLTISNQVRFPVYDKDGNFSWDKIDVFNSLSIYPGDLILLSSVEKTKLPSWCSAILLSKSTTGRKGIEHLHSGWGECGFEGQWTFEVKNETKSKIIIRPGDRLFQLVFFIHQEPRINYAEKKDSHYKKQTGPTRNFDYVKHTGYCNYRD